MHVRFTHTKERVTAGCIVYRFCCKGRSCSRWSHYKGRWVFLWLPTALFGKSICYLSVRLYVCKNDTATSEKLYPSRVLQVESSLNKESSVFLVSTIFHIRTRKCMKLFYGKYKNILHMHNQCVPGRSSGGRAWGRGYLRSSSLLHATIHKHLIGWKIPQKKLWEKFVRVD